MKHDKFCRKSISIDSTIGEMNQIFSKDGFKLKAKPNYLFFIVNYLIFACNYNYREKVFGLRCLTQTGLNLSTLSLIIKI